MPLVAKDKLTGDRVDITRYPSPRTELDSTNLVCPLCEIEMIVVAGLIKIHHFRHKTECLSDCARHPESYEHLKTKAYIRDTMKDWFAEFTTAQPELEVIIPEANRQADILFSFPNGWRVACEVQLASITIEELEERTNDYLRAGIDTFWFFGKSAASPTNLEWSTKTYGYVFKLYYKEYDTETEIATAKI
jgi:competence protein CoiA